MRPSRPSRFWILVRAAAVMMVITLPARARGQEHRSLHSSAQITDSAAVAATVHAFHEALRRGDSATVRTLLARDVRVAESGGIETRDEYLSHHLPGDMAYAAAVMRTPGVTHVTVMGDIAWATSGSRTTGSFRDRAIDSRGAELMVLSRDGGSWRIRAIHWSSRQAR